MAVVNVSVKIIGVAQRVAIIVTTPFEPCETLSLRQKRKLAVFVLVNSVRFSDNRSDGGQETVFSLAFRGVRPFKGGFKGIDGKRCLRAIERGRETNGCNMPLEPCFFRTKLGYEVSYVLNRGVSRLES